LVAMDVLRRLEHPLEGPCLIDGAAARHDRCEAASGAGTIGVLHAGLVRDQPLIPATGRIHALDPVEPALPASRVIRTGRGAGGPAAVPWFWGHCLPASWKWNACGVSPGSSFVSSPGIESATGFLNTIPRGPSRNARPPAVTLSIVASSTGT